MPNPEARSFFYPGHIGLGNGPHMYSMYIVQYHICGVLHTSQSECWISSEFKPKTVLVRGQGWFGLYEQIRKSHLMNTPNLNYPGCGAKMHTLFGIIFWNNCAWLNMFCALLNAAHFEGQWVWLSFYISFYKDGTPQAPTSVHQYLYHICTHRGRGD